MSYTIEKITSPHTSSRDSYKPELIVCHICDGTYAGTKSWFLNGTTEVSSNYIVGQNGQICECVSISKMAWCNGTSADSSKPTYYGHSTVALVKSKGGNANKYSVSIECEGYYSKTKGKLTDAQFNALVWLVQKIQADVKATYGNTIPFDRQHIVGHYEVTPKTRTSCPGELFQWDALINALNGSSITQEAVQDDVKPYRVRKSANDVNSQIGAYNDLSNAKKQADSNTGYNVYDKSGNLIYSPVAIKAGDTVRITGSTYATGQAVPAWAKSTAHVVSKISGEKALLGANGGINSWVKLIDLIKA